MILVRPRHSAGWHQARRVPPGDALDLGDRLAAAWTEGGRELLVATTMRSSASGAAYFGKHQLWTTPTPPPVRYDDGAAVGCPAPMMNVVAWLSDRVPTAAGQSPLMVEPQPSDLFAETGWIASPRCTPGYEPLVLTLALAPVR